MGVQIDSTVAGSTLQFFRDEMSRSKSMARRSKRRSPVNVAFEKAAERAEASRKAADEALLKALRGESPAYIKPAIPGTGGREERIRLADLFARLKQLNDNPEAARQAAQAATEQVNIQLERQTTEVEISIDINKPVYGLERIDEKYAQTDRYLFEFRDGTTFVIKDKWSGKSTMIYGDPHVDVDDVQGGLDGDFKDLVESERYTTFMLQDGTRLTITALDSGIIEKVDIFHRSQHLRGTGAGASDWETQQLFAGDVQNSAGYESMLERGDVIVAGGDGNDWYNEAGALVWGKTTGPVVYSRPSLSMDVKIKQTVETFNFIGRRDVRV